MPGTGEARDSWHIRRDGDVLILESKSPGMWHIEYGRKPNRAPPPRHVIEQWLVDRFGMDRSRAKRESWIVAKRIGERGIPPAGIVQQITSEYGAKIR